MKNDKEVKRAVVAIRPQHVGGHDGVDFFRKKWQKELKADRQLEGLSYGLCKVAYKRDIEDSGCTL